MQGLTGFDIDEALLRIKKGLEKYRWIQDNVLISDVSSDTHFQTNFNNFYKVRRSAHWRHHYYSLMQRAKSQELTFGQALLILKETTGRIEASFVSKLVGTLYPSSP